MTVVTPTDRPKSVRNRSVIEVFGGVFVLSIDFEFSVGIGVFVIGLSQISFIFFDTHIFSMYLFFLQVEVQWLAMHCDPTKPTRDDCEELPDGKTKVDFQASIKKALSEKGNK